VNKENTLDKSVLEESAKNNPDGGGIMYADKGQIHVYKCMSKKSVIKRYYAIRKTFTGVICLHFRIATDGEVNVANCHPYKVNDSTYLMHNGILSEYSGLMTDKADTQLFIEDILKGFTVKELFSDNVLKLIAKTIGTGNKFAIMEAGGKCTIVNSKMGHYDEQGNWYSNTSYKPYVPIKYPPMSYYKNAGYKPNQAYCSGCGCYLTPSEQKEGICSYCKQYIITQTNKDESQYCDYCGNVLTYYTEKQDGICVMCAKELENADVPYANRRDI